MVLREPLAVRSIVGGKSGRESARVRFLVGADVLELADVAHVERMSGSVVLHHGHAALLLVGLCGADAGRLMDFATVNERGLRGKTALRLNLVELLWLRGRLESVALEPLILLERLGKVSTLAAASLVPELSLAMARIALVELEKLAVILLLLSGNAFFLLVGVAALFGALRVLATSTVSFRNVIVPKLLNWHDFGRLFGSINLRTIDSTAEHRA